LIYKTVIDTNIYISAIFWGGNPRKIIDLARDRNIFVFTSVAIKDEISNTLIKKFKLSKKEIELIMSDFSTFTIPVKITKNVYPVKDDPDDNKFIDCALESNADYIISGDKHLLRLQKYDNICILNSSNFLANLLT